MGLVASVLNSTGLEQLGGALHRAKLTLRITCTISFNPQSRPVLPQKKVRLRGVGHVPAVSRGDRGNGRAGTRRDAPAAVR